MKFLKTKLKMTQILLLLFLFNLLLLNCMFKPDSPSKRSPTEAEKIEEVNNIKKESEWYEYEPQIVTLKGILIMSTNYGPPNYGENPEEDEKITYYILKLDNPINVRGDINRNINSDTFENIFKIQIVLDDSNKNMIKGKINKKVLLKGTLFQAITGHHYTDVLINVQQIKLLNNQ